MAFSELKARWAGTYPKGTPTRFKDLDAFDKMLHGELYDVLPHPFDKEEEGGRTIKLRERRPSVQISMAKVITDQTSSLLFGEAHAPHIRYWIQNAVGSETPEQLATQDAIDKIVFASEAVSIMLEAVKKGATGSCAVILYAMPDKTPWLDVVEGKFCTPVFDPRDPRRLTSLNREYPLIGKELYALGYDEEKYGAKKTYWMRIDLNADAETWMLPLTNERYQALGENDPDAHGQKIRWIKDEERTYVHPFNFVPAVWIRNMGERRAIDGPCTFEAIVDLQIELDYTVSQAGRGYHYTADPMMVLMEGLLGDMDPMGGMNELDSEDATVAIDKSPARALTVSNGGDAKMLEITGQGLTGALAYARLIREYAFEVLSGNKADQDDKTGGPQSGKALEVLTQALVWLVEVLRTPFGQRGFLPLVKMMLQALKDGALVLDDINIDKVDPSMPMRIFWPEWYRPQGQDLMNALTGLVTAAGGSTSMPKQIIPLEVAAREAAMLLNEPDPNECVRQVLIENPPAEQNDMIRQHLNSTSSTRSQPPPSLSSGNLTVSRNSGTITKRETLLQHALVTHLFPTRCLLRG